MSDPRCRPVPPELVALVRDCLQRRGRQGAARAIGISASTLTSIVAGLDAMPGTIALLQQYARRRQAERTMGPGVAAIDDPRRGGPTC